MLAGKKCLARAPPTSNKALPVDAGARQEKTLAMNTTEHKDGRATYSPEDNKLRLYVGRVPRDEYEALRAQGWTSTPKQDCDFVAVWTPDRRDTALDYAGIIEDEDQGPADRAADRAERFAGYREKRTAEACGHADHYDATPSAHGYQSAARAERSAARHDRVAARAVDAWSKAEYWQRRTAGVISHALYVSKPGVRMGRIKTLEAELRKFLARWNCPEDQIDNQHAKDWITHTRLRLTYENQMLAAQGGRLEQEDVQAGGKLGGRLIVKVSKSSVTGRVTAAYVLGPKVSGYAYQVSNIPGTEYAEYKFETERLSPDAYTPPTEESLAELKKLKAEFKKAAQAIAGPSCPLINPTEADAERLQALWNEHARAEHEARNKRNGYTLTEFKPSEILKTTQATYSHNSKGSYACAGTREVFAGGYECPTYYAAADKMREKHGAPLFEIRRTSGGNYQASRVIVLLDKPQKPLPAAVWAQPFTLTAETVNA